MLTTYRFQELGAADLQRLTARNVDSDKEIEARVQEIIENVRKNGDEALKYYGRKFEKVELDEIVITEEEIASQASLVNRSEKRAIEIAFNNIFKFHQAQLKREKRLETTPGVSCWRETRPIERVGIYIPGGSAVLPSTFLMLGVPARIAGCKEIVVCTPPQPDGKLNPYIAYCAQLLKIGSVYTCGGAQAIAAMAYGTQSVPQVDKIFGPGNQYVTKAKTLIQTQTTAAIDMPAGPSEVLVVADHSSNPVFVAADLIAQAEHGPDSQSVLLSTDADLIARVQVELEKQLQVLPRAEIARKALSKSYAMEFESISDLMRFSNQYAPEHLIISTDEPDSCISLIVNAGSVFLGHLTPESAGDYASGTNHTLPTSAYAKSYSGVSVDSFVKRITFQQISEQGIRNLGPVIETLAGIEGLQGHKHAVSVRLNSLDSTLTSNNEPI
jgi:histidinol dehydrogenase